MKRNFLFPKILLAGFMLVCFSTSYGQAPENAKPTSTLPAELNTIFTNSCMKCHGAGGGSFALSKVDFSKWDQYTAKVQAAKAKFIQQVVDNGSMPPKSFVNANPSTALSKDQIETIRKWSVAVAAKK